MAAQGLTALGRNTRNSGTERMSRALSLKAGTGAFGGAAGVKTAKLCVEQDQIGEHWTASLSSRVRSLEAASNRRSRGMIIHSYRAAFGTW